MNHFTSSQTITELERVVGANHVLTGAEHIAGFATDYTQRWSTQPLAVVRPGTSQELSQLITLGIDHGFSLTAQGGNTSLVGGAIGQDNGVIVSTSRLQEWSINSTDNTLQAQAGVTLAQAQKYADDHELVFPVNTASRDSATLGGLIATNAGGSRSIRWGAMRTHVLGVEVVLGNGNIVRRMKPLYRDNVGYDIPQLIAGSEGTLGIITDTLCRLQPRTSLHSSVMLLPAQSFEQGLHLIHAGQEQGLVVEAAEFMTQKGANIVADHTGIPQPFPDDPIIFLIEFSSPQPEPYDLLADLLEATVGTANTQRTIIEPVPARKLWHLREEHTETINKTTRTPVIKLDVAVPGTSLDSFMEQLPRRLHKYPGAYDICFGHFAEGNIHANILDSDPQDYLTISTEIFELVTELNGSISAEHGIGRAKSQWMHLGRTSEDLAVMQAIRQACDPHHILAPELLDFSVKR